MDARGVNGSSSATRYCGHVCEWPNGGCGARIYFLVNDRGNVQPFNVSDSRPHHGSCPPFRKLKEAATTCPNCGGKRLKNGDCKHCGWLAPLGPDAPMRPPPDHIKRFF